MNELTAATKPRLEWQEIFLSFFPPAKRTRRAKDRLTVWRLPLILLLQTVLDVAADRHSQPRGGPLHP